MLVNCDATNSHRQIADGMATATRAEQAEVTGMSLMIMMKWVAEPYGRAYFDLYADSGALLVTSETFEKRYVAQHAGEKIIESCKTDSLNWDMHFDSTSGRFRGLIRDADGRHLASTIDFDSEADVEAAIGVVVDDVKRVETTFVM